MGKSDVWDTPTPRLRVRGQESYRGSWRLGGLGLVAWTQHGKIKEALLPACAPNSICKDVRWVISSLNYREMPLILAWAIPEQGQRCCWSLCSMLPRYTELLLAKMAVLRFSIPVLNSNLMHDLSAFVILRGSQKLCHAPPPSHLNT